jgi:single-strand DNA-binding protein
VKKMPNYADMTLMGHVGRLPEIKEFGDKKLATFSMAVSRKVKGEKVSSWFSVKAWGFNADFVSNYVDKGTAILVAGEPIEETWEGKDGTKKSKIVLNANRITFAGSKSDNASAEESFKPAATPKLDDMPF